MKNISEYTIPLSMVDVDPFFKLMGITQSGLEKAEAAKRPQISRVIFNDPATVVKWTDGTKTIVKCGELDKFDQEKGLALAIAKKYYGNTGRYYDEMKKWLQDDDSAQTKKAKKSDKDESGREEIKELLGLLF